MKKLFALALSLILLVTTGSAALAAPAGDTAMTERLKAVTLKVKETLGIGDEFTTFSGNLNESGTASLWSLNWSSDKEQIYVTANENGTVVNYSDNLAGDSGKTYAVYGRIPRFPAMSLDEAKTVANAFLAKVLDSKTETVALTGTSSLDYTGSAQYYLGGTMKLNGLETPIAINATVSASANRVVNFYRNDAGQSYSGAADPSKAGDKAAASAALLGTLKMKMTYALPGDGTHTARLQYTPNPGGSFVVDAVTGKLIDLSKLDYGPTPYPTEKQMSMADNGSTGYGGASITPAEQATIDQLQGVLSQSALESAVRAYSELGLSGLTLQHVNYYTYKDDNKQTQVTANLQFNSAAKDAQSQYRYVSVDARTGKLLSVSGSYVYTDKKDASATYKYTNDQTEATARSFAGKVLPDEFKQTVLSTDVSSPADTNIRNYVFNRSHENIVFPENSITVSVDAQTGYVTNFYYNWYKFDVTFTAPAGAITADSAAAKYSQGAGIALKYVDVPVDTQASGLLLAYTTADITVWGVNATTGALLKVNDPETEAALKYDDISGSPYRTMIDKLASFGIGFPGTSFKPSTALTQLDALILIESTNGRKIVVPMSAAGTVGPVGSKVAAGSSAGGSISASVATAPGDSSSDDIYSMAYNMGLLTPDEKNPTKELTRAEFVKLLVNAMGYKEVAVMRGIYAPGFKDDGTIPDGFAGYIALGKGFGILRGDQNGNCRAGDTATRGEAAVMLYNCMSRK